jgi:hypothetical protein
MARFPGIRGTGRADRRAPSAGIAWIATLAVSTACGGGGVDDGADVADTGSEDVVLDAADGDSAQPDEGVGAEDVPVVDTPAEEAPNDDASGDELAGEDDGGEADAPGEDVIGDAGDGEAEVAADAPGEDAPAEDAVADDAGPGPDCWNGVVDPGEECDGDPPRDCVTACGSVGSQACVACRWDAICIPPVEVCNGFDDDCLSGADDGFDCILGRTRRCTTSCASTGRQACEPGCTWAVDCTPPPETCNGRDDDCDTVVDNGLECLPGETRPCVLGGCSGTQTCGTACRWDPCDTGPAPANDTCAGVVDLAVGTTVTGTTCGAHDDYFGTCGGGGGGPDVVFRLDVAVATSLQIDTAGTGYDTVLHVHGTCASWDPMTCNDDYSGAETARIDSVFFPRTYYIMLDGKTDAERGPFTLSVTAP